MNRLAKTNLSMFVMSVTAAWWDAARAGRGVAYLELASPLICDTEHLSAFKQVPGGIGNFANQ